MGLFLIYGRWLGFVENFLGLSRSSRDVLYCLCLLYGLIRLCWRCSSPSKVYSLRGWVERMIA